MTFRRGARLDPTQVEDYRGRRLGGGTGIAVGGGGLGILVLAVIVYFLGGNPSDVIDLNNVSVGGRATRPPCSASARRASRRMPTRTAGSSGT